MISVGIDVAKGKSTVCILKPYGEIVSKPFDISHVEKDLGELAAMLLRFDDEVKVVMEATGIYHLPVLTYLQEKGLFVAVINPYLMKVYRSGDLRKAKTDKIDSRIIANYGIEHWFTMAEFKASDDVYGELKMLGQQYRHYIENSKNSEWMRTIFDGMQICDKRIFIMRGWLTVLLTDVRNPKKSMPYQLLPLL